MRSAPLTGTATNIFRSIVHSVAKDAIRAPHGDCNTRMGYFLAAIFAGCDPRPSRGLQLLSPSMEARINLDAIRAPHGDCNLLINQSNSHFVKMRPAPLTGTATRLAFADTGEDTKGCDQRPSRGLQLFMSSVSTLFLLVMRSAPLTGTATLVLLKRDTSKLTGCDPRPSRGLQLFSVIVKTGVS